MIFLIDTKCKICFIYIYKIQVKKKDKKSKKSGKSVRWEGKGPDAYWQVFLFSQFLDAFLLRGNIIKKQKRKDNLWNLGARSPPRQPPSAKTRQGPTFEISIETQRLFSLQQICHI